MGGGINFTQKIMILANLAHLRLTFVSCVQKIVTTGRVGILTKNTDNSKKKSAILVLLL